MDIFTKKQKHISCWKIKTPECKMDFSLNRRKKEQIKVEHKKDLFYVYILKSSVNNARENRAKNPNEH